VAIVLMSVLTGWLLQRYTDDPQPYLDAFTTVPAIAAQILMVMAYREQWYLWLMVDVLALVMWLRAENYCMAAQYAFWCANCIYGYVQWTKSMK
jgi:nicotinamide mononucleotide transporter